MFNKISDLYSHWGCGVVYKKKQNFWTYFIKFLQSYGPILGANICWGHSVLQRLAGGILFYKDWLGAYCFTKTGSSYLILGGILSFWF